MADLAIFSSDFPQPLWGFPLADHHCIRSRIHEHRNSKVFKRINPFPVYRNTKIRNFKRINPFPVYISTKKSKIFKRINPFPVYMSQKSKIQRKHPFSEAVSIRGGLGYTIRNAEQHVKYSGEGQRRSQVNN